MTQITPHAGVRRNLRHLRAIEFEPHKTLEPETSIPPEPLGSLHYGWVEQASLLVHAQAGALSVNPQSKIR